MNIIFFGSDDFASVHLEALLRRERSRPFPAHNVLACVCPPDRPKGRGMKMLPGPVKALAVQEKIPVYQPLTVRDKEFQSKLKELKADLFVVIAYGQILPKSVLDIPKQYAINVHSSLLPKYRGAAPINWAIINGEKRTGISIIRMNEKMDAGDIVAQMEIEISADDTSQSLREKMKKTGPAFLLETINRIDKNKVRPVPQDPDDVSFAPKLSKELGRIDWAKAADEITNLVRGLKPWPTAYTFYKGKMMKVLDAETVCATLKAQPGALNEVTKDYFTVAAARHSVKINQVHLESSKPMSSREFLVGHPLKAGEKLG